jgi:hypothetical protein
MTFNVETQSQPHSGAWVAFSYISFGAAVIMTAGGLYFTQIDPWVKAYFGMASVLLIQACFTLAKTLRDVHEGQKFINRLDQAKTEKLLSNVEVR